MISSLFYYEATRFRGSHSKSLISQMSHVLRSIYQELSGQRRKVCYYKRCPKQRQISAKGGKTMSQQYNSLSTVCATCNYWGGWHDLKQYGDYVEIDSPMDTGSCYSNNSGWKNGSPTQACGGCMHWEKWSALR